MKKAARFSVSLNEELLARFDRLIQDERYPTRSKAVADLIRERLVRKEWTKGKSVAGALVLVYDHHKKDLLHKLTHVQHEFGHLVISSQHIHLDPSNCLEIIVVKGSPTNITELSRKLKATKGVKHCSLSMASTGKNL